jgi:hypothetical protein
MGNGGRDLLYGALEDDDLDGGSDHDHLNGAEGRNTCINGEEVYNCKSGAS